MLRPGEELIVMRTTHWSGGRGDSLVEATMAEILYDLRIRGMLVQRRNTTETRRCGGRIRDGGHFRFGGDQQDGEQNVESNGRVGAKNDRT